MKQILVYTALPLNNATTVLHDDLVKVVKLAATIVDVTFLCTSKKILKYYSERLDSLSNVKFVCEKPLTDCKDGSHIFKHNNWIDKLDDRYDSFLTWGLLSSSLKQVLSVIDTLHNDNLFKVTFMSSLMHIFPFVIVDDVLHKYNGLKMYCKVTDYNEPDMTKIYSNATMLGLYDDLARGYKKSHDTEYCNFIDGFKDAEKTQDFVFGYTVTFAARKYLSKFVAENIVENDKMKLFLKDNYWKDGKRDNLIPHEQYNDELAKTKYTLIAPSTVMSEFSLERFNEAIVRKCLPIFMKEVKYATVFDNNYELCKFIEDNLTYDSRYSSMLQFIDLHDYASLVELFYNLDYIKKHLDLKHLLKKVLTEIGL